jgi:hypothetical protein
MATSSMLPLAEFFETENMPWKTVFKIQKRFNEDLDWKIDNE